MLYLNHVAILGSLDSWLNEPLKNLISCPSEFVWHLNWVYLWKRQDWAPSFYFVANHNQDPYCTLWSLNNVKPPNNQLLKITSLSFNRKRPKKKKKKGLQSSGPWTDLNGSSGLVLGLHHIQIRWGFNLDLVSNFLHIYFSLISAPFVFVEA